MTQETRQILFTGRVQGVGFRWATNRIAQNHPINGFVRNLPDGRVELVCQGDPDDIDGLLSDVKEHFAQNITNVAQVPSADIQSFSTFEIRS